MCNAKWALCSVLCREQVPFWWNDNDDVSFVLNQHAESELRWPGRVIRSCSSSGAYRVNIITNSVISLDWGKARELFTTNGAYRWIWLASFRFLEKPQYGIWTNKGTSRREKEHSLNPLNACIYILHIQLFCFKLLWCNYCFFFYLSISTTYYEWR